MKRRRVCAKLTEPLLHVRVINLPTRADRRVFQQETFFRGISKLQPCISALFASAEQLTKNKQWTPYLKWQLNGEQLQILEKQWGEMLGFESANPSELQKFHGRPITQGEMGCFLSHYRIWCEVADCMDAEDQNNVLIMEDDVCPLIVPSPDVSDYHRAWESVLCDLHDALRLLREHQIPWDLLYVGRNAFESKEATAIPRPHVVYAGFSSCTHAYCVSPRSARLLKSLAEHDLTRQNVIPLDEWLPALFTGKHPRADVSAMVARLVSSFGCASGDSDPSPILRALALAPDRVFQLESVVAEEQDERVFDSSGNALTPPLRLLASSDVCSDTSAEHLARLYECRHTLTSKLDEPSVQLRFLPGYIWGYVLGAFLRPVHIVKMAQTSLSFSQHLHPRDPLWRDALMTWMHRNGQRVVGSVRASWFHLAVQCWQKRSSLDDSSDPCLHDIGIHTAWSSRLLQQLQRSFPSIESYPYHSYVEQLAVLSADSAKEFLQRHQSGLGRPVLLKGAVSSSMLQSWSLDRLLQMPSLRHRLWSCVVQDADDKGGRIASEVLMTLADFAVYCCSAPSYEEEPLYLFEHDLPHDLLRQRPLIPLCADMIEELLKEQEELLLQPPGHPAHRSDTAGAIRQRTSPPPTLMDEHEWLVIGPCSSGSRVHQDPFGTCAYNVLLSGTKLWVLFPPTSSEEDVVLSSDASNASTACAARRWMSRLASLSQFHDVSTHRVLRHARFAIQNAGDVVFVPSEWHHCVLNVSEECCVAYTRNIVTKHNVRSVVRNLSQYSWQMDVAQRLTGLAWRDRFDDADSDSDA